MYVSHFLFLKTQTINDSIYAQIQLWTSFQSLPISKVLLLLLLVVKQLLDSQSKTSTHISMGFLVDSLGIERKRNFQLTTFLFNQMWSQQK